MLYPKTEYCESDAICTCGKPNYRLDNDGRQLYAIYEVTIPTPPYGERTFHLCEDCLKILQPPKSEKGANK